MTGTTISSSVTVGVTLTVASQNPVTVTSAGTVSVSDTNASAIYGVFGVPGTIANSGVLAAANGYGIKLLSGGTVTNGSASNTTASISGALYGVRMGIHGTGTVRNFGTIANTSTTIGRGVQVLGSGNVINGSTADTVASISGYYDGVRIAGPGSTVTNFGTIGASATFGIGVYLRTGGSVINGSAADTIASIHGVQFGVEIAHGSGTVTNFGTIKGTGTQFARGIVIAEGGSVVNGSNSDTAAYIGAYNRNGIYIGGTVASSVTNFGTIKSAGLTTKSTSGIVMRPGGTVTNGSATDTVATIIGVRQGVYIRGDLASAVVNFGTIQSLAANGLSLYLGASVTNGSTADTVAVIKGITGIYEGGAATITNFGTVTASGTAIVLNKGGKVINGGTANTAALIIGGTGISGGLAAATINNFGTVTAFGTGLVLTTGGTATNGSATDKTARITGNSTGISGGSAPSTISNFGTITGLSGTGVALTTSGSVTNGSSADITALVSGAGTGISGGSAPSTISNFGTVLASSGTAIASTGGNVTNGSAADKTALISGAGTGISGGAAAATVSNFGTILGSTGTAVVLTTGGSVTNGSTADTAALISGGNTGLSSNTVPATVTNFGTINATLNTGFNNAVFLAFGGTVTNGSTADTKATIMAAASGVKFGIHGPGTLNNFGTIENTSTTLGAGVAAADGATIVNGGPTSKDALITGYYQGVNIFSAGGTVTNFAKIAATSTFGSGVYLGIGGSVTNGSSADTTALITSDDIGINIAHVAGTVTNFGTVMGTGSLGRGVAMSAGGRVVNGSSADTTALISGSSRNGVYMGGTGSSTVTNYGTIKGVGAANLSSGVNIRGSGTVTNGSATDTKASISGTNHGIYIEGLVAAVVNNFGTVASTAKSSISLYLGGNVTNGSAADTTAKITGASGVYIGGKGMVTNFGAITGNAGSGVSLRQGGAIVNGSAADKTASIAVVGNSGTHSAIYNMTGATTITNFGTVISSTSSAIHLNTGGTISNGSAADTSARINGASGHAGIVIVTGTALVTNFGTIMGGNNGISFTDGTVSATGTVINAGTISNGGGAAGSAITFGSGNDRLVADPGAVFVGKVSGGAGTNTLELASGAASGTIGGIGTKFTSFGNLDVDSGANWTLTGNNTATTVLNDGTLAIAASGSLHVTGSVSPISNGVFELNSGSLLEIAANTGAADQIKFLGTGEVMVDKATSFGISVGTTAYAGPLIESFTVGDKIDLHDVAFSSITLNFDAASGLLQVSGGAVAKASLLFDNSTLGAGTFQATNDGTGHTLIALS